MPGQPERLRARGGYEADMIWKAGRLQEATLIVMHSGLCRIRSPYELMIREEVFHLPCMMCFPSI
ncbi:glycoside hydrolase family 95-like protein [Paenibacillus apiarius]|uniref:glycoside hydrolase family 95-like protein n=1 Tax=Paenibacillus apiarius TaxID=46240 RepID=UPI002DB71FE5|nr:hypothetical protein [Paenibacillus apiarius]